MLNESALLLDDTLKPATPLTNGAVNFIVNTGWTELTALSTVGVYRQFTLADSPLCSRKIHDGSCACIWQQAELIGWHR